MHLAEHDQVLVWRILAKHLPDGISVWVYGSRAHGKNLKPFSDLDLCLAALSGALPEGMLARLKQAFDDSNLPFKVDLIDKHEMDPEFLKAIAPSFVPFPFHARVT